MCSTLLIAGLVASTAFQALGAFQQSSMAKAQAKYQAKLAENQALDARQRAEAEEDEKRRQIAQTVGTARARQAANGLLVDDTPDSTNFQLIDDLIVAGELDILRIRDNGERQARGAEAQAELYKTQAKNQNPLLAGLGAGISAGVSAYGSYSTLVGGGGGGSVTFASGAPSYSAGPSFESFGRY